MAHELEFSDRNRFQECNKMMHKFARSYFVVLVQMRNILCTSSLISSMPCVESWAGWLWRAKLWRTRSPHAHALSRICLNITINIVQHRQTAQTPTTINKCESFSSVLRSIFEWSLINNNKEEKNNNKNKQTFSSAHKSNVNLQTGSCQKEKWCLNETPTTVVDSILCKHQRRQQRWRQHQNKPTHKSTNTRRIKFQFSEIFVYLRLIGFPTSVPELKFL